MNERDFLNFLKLELDLELDNESKNNLKIFNNLLLEYNKHTNITAIRNTNDVYLKHFIDSLMLCKVIDLKQDLSILDIGSGGGFPGIVLAIVFPNLKITLLDSNNKKTEFQKIVINNLNLKNVQAINDRAEIFFANGYKYDLVVARAVANLNILSELAIPYIKVGGFFVAMKSDRNDEIEQAKYAIKFLGGKIDSIKQYKLPNLEDVRLLIKILKNKETKEGFPRSYNQILKKPINYK